MSLKDLLEYYGRQGAPGDQTALVNLLKELQQSYGAVPKWAVAEIAESYKIKESFILAVVKRIPSLRLQDTHVLELCAGPNCGKHTALADFAQQLAKENPGRFTLKFSPCMRLCGKGPNVKWDGTLHHRADEALLRQLIGKKE